MPVPATPLAERFQRATQDVIEFANGLSDDQWHAVDPAEGLSIGAMVHHLAAGDRLARTVLQALAQGADRASRQTEVATEDRERLQAQEAALEGMALLNIALNMTNGWPWQTGWKLLGPTGSSAEAGT